ncbi:MAG TPA: precorrin-6Y C5,15-methyltransferase (decarboxylating) subunit CbiT [Bacillota bacterium]|nr:precorrin-6Y C5,15-methyltransferase (decarboxylating) subunit CbiT [Bacillota bacterium]
MSKKWVFRTPGIPDDFFIRGSVPMTKEEIRVITLAKARLAPGQVVWDVGAGTGSLSVEAALQAKGGVVYAIERDSHGVSLIETNSRAFGVENLRILEGDAPGVLRELPDPDRVMIGGSGGKLREIVAESCSRLKPGGRIVINAVTLENAALSVKLLDELLGGSEAVQICVARAVRAGNGRIMRGANPVTVISAEKGESNVAG